MMGKLEVKGIDKAPPLLRGDQAKSIHVPAGFLCFLRIPRHVGSVLQKHILQSRYLHVFLVFSFSAFFVNVTSNTLLSLC